MTATDEHTDVDYCILGAGPAGIQLGMYLEQSNRSYVVLERGETPGTFFRTHPRHRKLISINKVYTGHCDPEINLRWDWNGLLTSEERFQFRNYSKKYFPDADDLVRYLIDFAEEHDIRIRCGVDVQEVRREEETFVITDQHGRSVRCGTLVVATGLSKPYIPAIQGIELAEQYDEVSVDPWDFENQRVLIIGKGNSGFETADNLIDTTALIHVASPRPVKFAWQSHFIGHLRAVNNNLLDTYLLKCQNATLEVEIEEIRKSDGQFEVTVAYQRAEGSRQTISYDRVICCTGFRMDTAMFDASCQPELTIHDRFPLLDSSWQSVNVPGMYFAGTLTQSRDFKKTTSGFIHGFRYNVQALAKILENRNHHEEIPHDELELSADVLTQSVLARVNRSSALWQQFSFLCDVITVCREQGTARYYEALPVDYVRDHPPGDATDYYTVTLEYGFQEDDDPFRTDRVAHTDVDNAAESTFLHPIVRHYQKGQLVSERHLVENLEANWTDESLHIVPLQEYFALAST